MTNTHPFHFPLVIKQIGEFLTVSVPDFEIMVSETTSHNPRIDKDYVTLINRLTLKAAKKVLEKMSQLDASGKNHYRPASLVRQTIQIKNKEQISTKTAAKYLGVSEASLKRWELAGVIQSQKSRGGHRRFVLGELDRVKDQMAKGQRPLTAKEQEQEKLRQIMVKASSGLIKTTPFIGKGL